MYMCIPSILVFVIVLILLVIDPPEYKLRNFISGLLAVAAFYLLCTASETVAWLLFLILTLDAIAFIYYL